MLNSSGFLLAFLVNFFLSTSSGAPSNSFSCFVFTSLIRNPAVLALYTVLLAFLFSPISHRARLFFPNLSLLLVPLLLEFHPLVPFLDGVMCLPNSCLSWGFVSSHLLFIFPIVLSPFSCISLPPRALFYGPLRTLPEPSFASKTT